MKVNFTVADVNDHDRPVSPGDGVVAIVVQFVPPEQRQAMFARMRHALVPGGTLLPSNRTARIRHRWAHVRVSAPTPPIHFEADSTDSRSKCYASTTLVREGTGHDGMSALVDLVATRELAL